MEKVVEVTRKRFGLGEEIGSSILESLIRNADYSQWGLANAFTNAANSDDIPYDTSSELEVIGGKIIELSPSEWKTISS